MSRSTSQENTAAAITRQVMQQNSGIEGPASHMTTFDGFSGAHGINEDSELLAIEEIKGQAGSQPRQIPRGATPANTDSQTSRMEQSSASSMTLSKITASQIPSHVHLVSDRELAANQQALSSIQANIEGRQTQMNKQFKDYDDLKGFKIAQQSIQGAEASTTIKEMSVETDHANWRKQQSSSSKKQGVTQQNMQNMIINSEGPRVAGFDLALGTTAAKTNPPSLRDKIKLDLCKKNLTPRDSQFATVSTPSQHISSAINGGSESKAQTMYLQKNRLLSAELDVYSSLEQSEPQQNSSGKGFRQVPATSMTSIKHHESLSGSGNTKIRKNKSILAITLTDIEKKHLGFQPSTTKKITSSTKQGTGVRGTTGSIEYNTISGASMTVGKAKKMSEISAQSQTALLRSMHNQQPSFASNILSKQQLSSSKAGTINHQQSPILTTPKKFHVQPSSHMMAANQQRSKKTGSGMKRHQIQAGQQHQRQREITDAQGFVIAQKSQTNSSGGGSALGPVRKANISIQMQKVTSEKKLASVTSHHQGAIAKSTFVDRDVRLSARDNGMEEKKVLNQVRVPKTDFQHDDSNKKSRLTSSSGKKSFQMQSKHSHALSQPSNMNEYLVKSQCNMQPHQQHQVCSPETVTPMTPLTQKMEAFNSTSLQTPFQSKSDIYTKIEMRRNSKKKKKVSGSMTGITGSLVISKTGSGRKYPGNDVRSQGTTSKIGDSSHQTLLHQAQVVLYPTQPQGFDVDSLQSSSAQNDQSDLHILYQSQNNANLHKSSQQDNNLFVNVQDSTLNQEDPANYQDIDYLADGVGTDDDGLPIVEELFDDNFVVAAKKQCSPIPEAEEGHINQFGKIKTFIEHRNTSSVNQQFSINALGGQKTENFDRNKAQLSKDRQASDQRSVHVKPMNLNEDNFIYNARSGVQTNSFNFAKNQGGVTQTRPTSTRLTGACIPQKASKGWNGTLQKVHNSVSSKQIGPIVIGTHPSTTKNEFAPNPWSQQLNPSSSSYKLAASQST